jgi:hypothetical protein
MKFGRRISLFLITLLFPIGVAGITLADYTASSFVRFCDDNPLICNRKEARGTKSGVKCPDPYSQVAERVLVHAGEEDIVYEMPHAGFRFETNINGLGGAYVESTLGYNLEWVAVVCSERALTPTPTRKVCKPCNTPTVTPTVTIIPTPTSTVASPTETPTATPTLTDQSPTPTPTPTASIQLTPTPASQTASSTGGTSEPKQAREGEVLGVSELAPTGMFLDHIANALISLSIISVILGVRRLHARGL